jgi:hypothetical protein
MTTGTHIELAVALAILVAGIWLYRRNRAADRGYGSQGAVLLFVVAVMVAIHALSLMQYRPSASELEAAKAHGR